MAVLDLLPKLVLDDPNHFQTILVLMYMTECVFVCDFPSWTAKTELLEMLEP